jgi:hypothetical protein
MSDGVEVNRENCLGNNKLIMYIGGEVMEIASFKIEPYLIYLIYTSVLALTLILVVPKPEIRRLAFSGIFLELFLIC